MIIAWIIGILFIAIGILGVLYAHRLWKRVALSAHINNINISNMPGKYEVAEGLQQQLFEAQPGNVLRLFWVWVIRIMGGGLASAGAVIIISMIFHR